MSDILNLIKERRSIRQFKKNKIDRESIEKILEAGRFAPSAENNQPWRFFVIEKSENIKKVGELCSYGPLNTFVSTAPLLIVIYTSASHRFVDLDCGMCAENMMLEAHSLGIGSCFIGAFREKLLKELLNLEDKTRIVSVIAFGYPEKVPPLPKRLTLEELTKFDTDTKIRKIGLFEKIFKTGPLSIFFRSKK